MQQQHPSCKMYMRALLKIMIMMKYTFLVEERTINLMMIMIPYKQYHLPLPEFVERVRRRENIGVIAVSFYDEICDLH